MFKHTEILTLLFVLILSVMALAAEDPDELYRQGRFTEAEKAYTHLDMDHPKDIRFRYNRACAAYQSSDYKGATAAFSSVLRRTKDNETRFKTAYNLGNTAFKQGDFATAVVYYKQAITYNPKNENAGYNLELALIQQEKQKQKKNKTKDQKKQSQKGSSQPQDKENKSKDSKEKKDSDKQSQDKTSEQKASQGQDQQDKKGESKQGKSARQDRDQKYEQESPKDLSGDLKPLQAMPDEGNTEGDKNTVQAMSAIDRKKAESLLDNLKEDRSRFMRFQVPKDKRNGVRSGKDW